MARRTRLLRYLAWGGGGLVLGALLAVLLLNLVARTERGNQWVLRQTLAALGKSIHGGKLEINRISGNLFQGAKLHGIALRDNQGQPFVLADSAFLEYDLRTLISPRILIRRATAYRPRVFVTRLPGDSVWNYQRIFTDTLPRDTLRQGVERVTLLDTIRIVDGSAEVRMEWRPDTTLSPAARRAEVAEVLADSSPIIVSRVRGGYVRTMSFARLNGRFSGIQFAPGTEAGSRIGIDSLAGDIQLYRTPARLSYVRAQLALMSDRIEFDAPDLRLPGSRLTTSGVVCTTTEGERCRRPVADGVMPYYDVAFRGDTVAFRDFQWLYRGFPADARGALQLVVESRPEGTLFLVREASVRTPRMRVAGDFGMILGDTLRFVDVDVEASPVHVPTIERMLPEGLPVRGLTLGGVEITGEPRGARTGGNGEARAPPRAEAEAEEDTTTGGGDRSTRRRR